MSEHTTDGLEIDEMPLRWFDQSACRYDIDDALDSADVPHIPWWMAVLSTLGIVFAVVVFGLGFAGLCMVLHP